MTASQERKEKEPFSPKAVIFDKDGILMHTEPIYFDAYAGTIKYFGGLKEYSWELHKGYMGFLSNEKFLKIKKEFDLDIPWDIFTEEYRRRYLETIESDGLSAASGIRELLGLLKEEGVKVAVATGSSRNNTTFTLAKTGLNKEFDVVITADDLTKGKPDPEPFLLAAERLGVEPHECVVVGDSINDVLAGKSAGMKVIAVVDSEYSADPSLARPDLEVNSLAEITMERLKEL